MHTRGDAQAMHCLPHDAQCCMQTAREQRGGAGWVKTVCASVILVNPIAKFALTIEPVALNVRSSVLGGLKSSQSYLSRCALSHATAVLASTHSAHACACLHRSVNAQAFVCNGQDYL